MPTLRKNVQAPLTYAATLGKYWKDARAPRAKDAPTVVSLFAGCGGSSLGYAMAGFDERLAVEWDDHAAVTFRANFPEVDLFHGDVAKLDAKAALDRARVREGELDVLDGSPPCQGFSTAGKRIIDDPRNSLFREYVRILEAFKPKALVMENVSGMVKGKMKPVFAEILREIKSRGYKVSARVLNASWYGVPQSRQRVIIVGIREDVGGEPGHPDPMGTRTTLAQACDGIDSVGPRLLGKFRSTWPHMKPMDSVADVIVRLGGRGSYFNPHKADWSSPCPTICKMVSPSIAGTAHPHRPHLLSIAAIKRCASFPDGFTLAGTFQEQWARIGNSVPPLLMRAIAMHVRSVLPAKILQRKKYNA